MTNRRELDLFVTEVLEGLDPHLILPIIRTRIYKFSLCSRYQEHEIFSEAYVQAIKKIEKGEKIPNLPLWFKKTTYYIIQDYSRREKSQRDKADKCKNLQDLIEEIEVSDYRTDPNLEMLNKALTKLEHQHLFILWLRIVEGWKWKQIGDYLVQWGLEPENTSKLPNTLSQRARRLLDKLYKDFFSA